MADTVDSSTTNEEPTPPSDTPPGGGPRSRIVRARTSVERVRRRSKEQQWREEFPYHWQADDLVTRRDTLRFLVAGSGALFITSGILSLVGSIRSGSDVNLVQIARVGELAVNESKTFTYPDAYGQGILINLPDKGLVAYSDVCTHLSCAVLFQPAENRLFCPCHEGIYNPATGDVVAGPPPRPLPIIQLAVRNGAIYAVREIER